MIELWKRSFYEQENMSWRILLCAKHKAKQTGRYEAFNIERILAWWMIVDDKVQAAEGKLATRLVHIGSFTSVYPFVIHIYWLRQEIDRRLKILHTYCTLNFSRVLCFIHFHLAGLFVVTEWTIEHDVQGNDVLLFWAGLSFRLSSSHFDLLIYI